MTDILKRMIHVSDVKDVEGEVEMKRFGDGTYTDPTTKVKTYYEAGWLSKFGMYVIVGNKIAHLDIGEFIGAAIGRIKEDA